MRSKKNILLIEFNELSQVLLERFIRNGELPNFAKFRGQSDTYSTDANEEIQHLEPWIQWVTVHTGVQYAEHRVFSLGDNKKLEYRTIGQILSDSGLLIGIFSSMNLKHTDVRGYCVPDPWDSEARTTPPSCQPYFDLISRQVKGSSVDKIPPITELLKAFIFLLRSGISFSTLCYGALQLFSERSNKKLKWRRATVLDRINYDIARNFHGRHKPVFATFFSNSTAHFQHYYWRNMEPEKFSVPPEQDDASLNRAILFGYKNMDYLLGRFMRDYQDALLVLCTGLSQEPWIETTKRTYRPIDFDWLLEFADIAIDRIGISPVMAEQFRIKCETETHALDVYGQLAELECDSAPLMRVSVVNKDVFGGCAFESKVAPESLCVNGKGREVAFGDLFHMIHGVRSGRHNPNGVFWVRNFENKIENQSIQLTEIAPAILQYFDIDTPVYMTKSSFSLSQ